MNSANEHHVSLPEKPASYRVVVLDKDGQILDTKRVLAQSDTQALAAAVVFLDGHAIELWDGVRFIEHFDPVG